MTSLSVNILAPKQKYKRGYLVAILIAIEENQTAIWKVFSSVIKPEKTISLIGYRNDAKALYNYHEAIIDSIRSTFKEGVRSIILVSPPKTNFSNKFLEHINNHHAWLSQGQNRVLVSQILGSALTMPQLMKLVKDPDFKKIIAQTTSEETENLIGLLEKTLNKSSVENLVLYSFNEIEDQILSSWLTGKPKPEYLLLTDVYLDNNRRKNRLHRLIQIAANRKIKTRIIKAESQAGKRLMQLGGFVCIQSIEQ